MRAAILDYEPFMGFEERLLRGQNDGRDCQAADDIYELARRYGIHDPAQAEILYSRACDEDYQATPTGVVYRRLLEEAARPKSAPRSWATALCGEPNRWAAPRPGVSPGKRSRTMTVAEEMAKREQYAERRHRAENATLSGIVSREGASLPGYSLVMSAIRNPAGRQEPMTGPGGHDESSDPQQSREIANARQGGAVDGKLPQPPPLWMGSVLGTSVPAAAPPIQGKGLDAIPAGESGAEQLDISPTDGGEPLPDEIRAKMEAALGMDFSAVRIHVSPQAERVGAVAFARGADIVIAPGHYQPWTRQGQELLAHELTHVVQQAEGRVMPSQRIAGVAINDDPGLESEADERAARAVAGALTLPRGSAGDGQNQAHREGGATKRVGGVTTPALQSDRAAARPLQAKTSGRHLLLESAFDCGPQGEFEDSREINPDTDPLAMRQLIPGDGSELSDVERAYFEERLRADLCHVRIHTGPKAAKLALRMGARALTFGNHIVFGEGEFAPATQSGKKLLAHELTHVLQQSEPSAPRSFRDRVSHDPGGGPPGVAHPTIMRKPLFASTLEIHHRLLNGRVFTVSENSVTITINAHWEFSSPEGNHHTDYHVNLVEEGLLLDSELCTATLPPNRVCTYTWSGLTPGRYFLRIWTNNTNPFRWLVGTVQVSEQSGAAVSSCTEQRGTDGLLEAVHLALDAAGLIPALGIIPDAINTGIYLIEGDWTNAGISAAAMVPVFGQGATVTKHGVRITREAIERLGREGLEQGLRSARAVRIGARFTESVLTSARRMVGQQSAALRKLQRRLGDPNSVGLFRSVPLTEDAAQGLVRQILGNATTQRFGRLKMSGFAGERGIALFDGAGRGILVRQTDGHFITFLEEPRGLGNIFR